MHTEDATGVLKTLTSHFKSDLAILNYEMIHPDDAFGRVMLENLMVSFTNIVNIVKIGKRVHATWNTRLSR